MGNRPVNRIVADARYHRARVADLEAALRDATAALERIKHIQHDARQHHDDAWLEATVIDSESIIDRALTAARKALE